jgi:ribosomal protein S24E
MKRHELTFEVAHATAATPSRDAVRGELSKLVKAPKDRVIIERMRARYGTSVTRGVATIYDSAEAAKAIVRSHILVRNGLKEKPVKATGPAAAAPGAPAPAPAAEPAPTAPAPPTGEKKE